MLMFSCITARYLPASRATPIQAEVSRSVDNPCGISSGKKGLVISEMTTPMRRLRPDTKARACVSGTLPQLAHGIPYSLCVRRIDGRNAIDGPGDGRD